MFKLAGRVGFRVDVRNFLELERTLHRHGILHTATEEQRVVFINKVLRQRFDRFVECQRFFNQARKLRELSDEVVLLFFLETVTACERDGQ